jgi:hypothetical protein
MGGREVGHSPAGQLSLSDAGGKLSSSPEPHWLKEHIPTFLLFLTYKHHSFTALPGGCALNAAWCYLKLSGCYHTRLPSTTQVHVFRVTVASVAGCGATIACGQIAETTAAY